MANEIMIPALPCLSLDEIFTFYVALGFKITYQQARPNLYGCVKYEDIELHFFAMKGIDPANSYSTCLAIVSDVDELHRGFAAGLKQHYGKVPTVGIPRLTRPNNNNAYGDRRFIVVDPSGNWVRFIQLGEKKRLDADASRLARAIHAASLLADSKGDFPAAAKLLEAALERNASEASTVELIQAWVLRAEIALQLEETELAHELVKKIGSMTLMDEEKAQLAEEFERITALAEALE